MTRSCRGASADGCSPRTAGEALSRVKVLVAVAVPGFARSQHGVLSSWLTNPSLPPARPLPHSAQDERVVVTAVRLPPRGSRAERVCTAISLLAGCKVRWGVPRKAAATTLVIYRLRQVDCAYPFNPPKSNSTHASSPTIHASCPAGMWKASPGPNSGSVPSSIFNAIRP